MVSRQILHSIEKIAPGVDGDLSLGSLNSRYRFAENSMHTLNHTLEKSVLDADGRYLDPHELSPYIALAVLRDDETYFKEQMMVWLDTILLAYKRNHHCATAYRYLQEAIGSTLPSSDTTLIRSYLDYIIQVLQSHV